MSKRHDHQIIVGNIGTVYNGTVKRTAQESYNEYVRQSQAGYGRAGNETVTWMLDNEIHKQHTAPNHLDLEYVVKVRVESTGEDRPVMDDELMRSVAAAIEYAIRHGEGEGHVHPMADQVAIHLDSIIFVTPERSRALHDVRPKV